MARTNLPRVRHALVDQIVSAYLHKLGSAGPVRPFERLALTTFGASVADELVGKLMTQDNLSALLRSGEFKGEPDLGVIPPLSKFDFSNFGTLTRRIVLVKPVEFSYRLGDEEDSGSVSLHLEATTWKLSALNLPSRTLQKLVGRLPLRP
ncbi:hypothetical protein ACVILH_002143 [Bradyrhizobium sp. USDA 4353]